MKIGINGLNWTVRAVDKDDDKLMVKGQPCLGVAYFNELLIVLDATLAKALFRQTVIHELVHAYAFSFGVHLVANERTEEPVCDFLGSHLDAIYSDTNKIMEFVFGEG